MGLPIVEIVARALPGDTETAKHALAREVLRTLRDHDRDPEVLVSRLEQCDAARLASDVRGAALESAHDEAMTLYADVRDQLVAVTKLATTRAGAVRILKAALDGQPLDVDTARAIVEGDPDAAQG